jgi:hypothetical protein
VADAGLSGKMNDPLRTLLGKELGHGLTISNILLDEPKTVSVGELFEPGLL